MDPVLETAATKLGTAHKKANGAAAPGGLLAMLLALLKSLGVVCPVTTSQEWLDMGPIRAAWQIRRGAIWLRRQTGEVIDIQQATATMLEARKDTTAADLDTTRAALEAD